MPAGFGVGFGPRCDSCLALRSLRVFAVVVFGASLTHAGQATRFAAVLVKFGALFQELATCALIVIHGVPPLGYTS